MAVAAISLTHQALGQTNNFIINLTQYLGLNFDEMTFRCTGALIAPQRIITTASCATVEAPYRLGIQLIHVIDGVNGGIVNISQMALGVTIHPRYVQTQDIEANIAVVNVSS